MCWFNMLRFAQAKVYISARTQANIFRIINAKYIWTIIMNLGIRLRILD
jgi:hypothetical protein